MSPSLRRLRLAWWHDLRCKLRRVCVADVRHHSRVLFGDCAVLPFALGIDLSLALARLGGGQLLPNRWTDATSTLISNVSSGRWGRRGMR
jgi:hypothetical protein